MGMRGGQGIFSLNKKYTKDLRRTKGRGLYLLGIEVRYHYYAVSLVEYV